MVAMYRELTMTVHEEPQKPNKSLGKAPFTTFTSRTEFYKRISFDWICPHFNRCKFPKTTSETEISNFCFIREQEKTYFAQVFRHLWIFLKKKIIDRLVERLLETFDDDGTCCCVISPVYGFDRFDDVKVLLIHNIFARFRVEIQAYCEQPFSWYSGLIWATLLYSKP